MRDRDLLTSLRAELREAGYFERATGRILVELAVLTVAGIATAYAAMATDSVLMRLGLIFVSGVVSLGVGTNTHTASHNATARKKKTNDALTYFGYPFFLGLSATWWWHKHVAVHHPAPNVVGIDGDADIAPWFALNEEDVRAGTKLQRFYYQHIQYYAFPVILGITGFRMQQFGVKHIAGMIREGGPRARKAWIDAASLLAHALFWLVLPLVWFSPGVVLAVYAGRVVVIGYAMFAMFGPGHWPEEAAAVAQDKHRGDYILLQTATTVNFTTGPLGRLLCGGLEYQIEHHLFPDISHPHYPAVSRHVQRFCREHSYPYRSYTWTRAVGLAMETFRSPKPVFYDMDALRVPPAPSPATHASAQAGD